MAASICLPMKAAFSSVNLPEQRIPSQKYSPHVRDILQALKAPSPPQLNDLCKHFASGAMICDEIPSRGLQQSF